MCHLFYKMGKNKQSNTSTRCQSEDQYGRQVGDPSRTNSVTVNQSYGKQIPATASFDEDPPQTMYEAVNVH